MGDELTAQLAEWGEDFEEKLNRAVAEEDEPLKRALSLLAAAEAVLKLHGPGRVTILGALCKRHENYRFFSITSTEADAVRACRDCAVTVYSSCTGCGPQMDVDACPTRAAITAALAETADA
jgi:hypothetical protein